MQRIATPTAAQDLFGPGKDGFRDGNQGTGVSSTQLESQWFNSLQEEICNAIELAGITLDVADMTQLWQALGTALGSAYLPLAGGTLTGPLTVNLATGNNAINVKSASAVGTTIWIDKLGSTAAAAISGLSAGVPRWAMILGDNIAEGGSNAGSNFSLVRYDDAGNPIIGLPPLTINRATGQATFSQNLNIITAASTAALALDGGAGFVRAITGRTTGLPRWQMQLGNNIAEGGSNAGSDFALQRFNDAGAVIDTPLSISRANGRMTLTGALTVAPANGNVSLNLTAPPGAFQAVVNLDSPPGQPKQIVAVAGTGALRWSMNFGSGAESTGNAGSNFVLARYSDANAVIDQPLIISRATGQATFTVAIVNGPSDRALKENIVPLEGSLDKVLALQGVSFDLIDDPEHRKQIGLIAQDVLPVVPEIIQRYQPDMEKQPALALDYPKLTALLIEALKELSTRVMALEGTQVGKPAARAN